MIVLFLDQDLWCDNNTYIIMLSIITIATVIVNQFDLLHHRCHIVVALLAMMCRWFKNGRVLSPFLE